MHIFLAGMNGLGLLVPYSTGITFRIQGAGVACEHKNLEGFYLPIEVSSCVRRIPKDTYDKKITDYIYKKYGDHCRGGIDTDDADHIDRVLSEDTFVNHSGLRLMVDRENMSSFMEAWIGVQVKIIEKKHPYYLGQFDYAYLTWPNSD